MGGPAAPRERERSRGRSRAESFPHPSGDAACRKRMDRARRACRPPVCHYGRRNPRAVGDRVLRHRAAIAQTFTAPSTFWGGCLGGWAPKKAPHSKTCSGEASERRLEGGAPRGVHQQLHREDHREHRRHKRRDGQRRLGEDLFERVLIVHEQVARRGADEDLDAGPIILQRAVEVLGGFRGIEAIDEHAYAVARSTAPALQREPASPVGNHLDSRHALEDV